MGKSKKHQDDHRNAAASRDVVKKEFQDLSDRMEHFQKKVKSGKSAARAKKTTSKR